MMGSVENTRIEPSVRGMVYASLFGALTAVGAFISVPLQPVPVTLHTLFVNLAAALLGGSLGALSQITYVLLGIIGLPVFSGGKAGFGVLLGPTGGYLIGFIAGAFFMGKLAELNSRPKFLYFFLIMVAGHVVIYSCGIIQLLYVAKLTLGKGLAVGVLPFLPGDLLKIWAASYIAVKLRDRIRI